MRHHGQKGNTVESEPAKLTIKNRDKDMTVLYVGDYHRQSRHFGAGFFNKLRDAPRS